MTAPSASAAVEQVSRSKRPVHKTPRYSRKDLQLAAATDIPIRALVAYEHAAAVQHSAQPSCELDWQFIAAFGRIETNHGRLNGSSIGADGIDRPAVLGPSLDGSNPGVIGALSDASGGAVRAAGPMQFIPSTWQRWGTGDMQNIDHAALAAGRYVCADGQTLNSDDARRQAALSYNHEDWYATDVLAIYHDYLDGQPAHEFPMAPGSSSGGPSDSSTGVAAAGLSSPSAAQAPNPPAQSSAPQPSSTTRSQSPSAAPSPTPSQSGSIPILPH